MHNKHLSIISREKNNLQMYRKTHIYTKHDYIYYKKYNYVRNTIDLFTLQLHIIINVFRVSLTKQFLSTIMLTFTNLQLGKHYSEHILCAGTGLTMVGLKY